MNDISYLGTVEHTGSDRKTDYLYRVSIKGLVRNDSGQVLVVKESGRAAWDLPGGGMDHNETLKVAIARELLEEVSLKCDFKYDIICVDEPVYLRNHQFWQMRLIFEVKPEIMSFSAGEDADEVAFIDPEVFKNSTSSVERKVYQYAQLMR